MPKRTLNKTAWGISAAGKTAIIIIALCICTDGVRSSPSRDSSRNTFIRDSISSSKRLYWLTVGVGVNDIGILGLLKANVAIGVESFIAKFLASATYSVGGSGPGGNMTEYGLYYGRQFFRDAIIGRVALGVCYLDGSRDYAQDKIHTFALGGEAELILQGQAFGLGISFFANAAPKYLFGGISLNAHLGKLD